VNVEGVKIFMLSFQLFTIYILFEFVHDFFNVTRLFVSLLAGLLDN
jgi:hypothetical protein